VQTVVSKTVMQQDGIEALNHNRQMLNRKDISVTSADTSHSQRSIIVIFIIFIIFDGELSAISYPALPRKR